jgi:hypothetical protein
LITLGIFSLVNLALVRVKLRQDPVDHTAIFNIPIWIPIGGFAVSAGFLLTKLVQLVSV